MNHMNPAPHCRCGHHKMFPLLVVLFGLLFLLGALGTVSAHTVAIGWPIIVILAGLVKLGGGSCKCYMQA